ncbi:hypothetical protein EsVE80_20560 [Enterococcus saigonensis]|uniref:Uncharacterized protein n=1 Tax=Enterococcus saigonensis TaxID=1805431 RepID=A0A679IEI6_9ENTE|nr:hypothetical protein [Enterococcus saigonensis]BCA86533.1 hypothetical protein EsVE80_20560 [Enterococcus saigonensis]
MLTAKIVQLKTSQTLLKKFIAGIENSTNDATISQLRDDLIDYGESLSVISYLVTEQEEIQSEKYEIRNILQQQYLLIQNIMAALQSAEGQQEAQEIFALTPGAIRRMRESLKGIMELNRTLQKEPNLIVDLTKVPVTNKTAVPEKQSFLKRLFKK